MVPEATWIPGSFKAVLRTVEVSKITGPGKGSLRCPGALGWLYARVLSGPMHSAALREGAAAE